MKLSRAIILGMSLAAPLVGQTALGQPIPAVYHFLNNEIIRISTAMTNDPNNEPLAFDETKRAGDFRLKVFALRLQATVGFDIPAAANLTLVPEVELFWEK